MQEAEGRAFESDGRQWEAKRGDLRSARAGPRDPVIVGQVRAARVDLLRSWGLDRQEAESLVRDAAASLAADEAEDGGDRPLTP